MISTKTLQALPPQGRIIFVGDVHGCIDEFNHLLNECRYNSANDAIVLVGDLVNKGYDSIAVVKRAMQLNAFCVLGNHDAALIARYDHIQDGDIDPKDAKYASDPMTATALTLPRECYKYLTSLPHILKVPQFDVVVVHAGVNPTQPLDKQNLWELLHMRRVLPNGRVIDGQSGGELWATKWRGPETIIFGHDARTGFQQHPFAIGLDSGCCYGGALTAYVLPGKRFVKVPGSRKAVTKKPPNASPATALGYSPSVEPSVAIAQGQLPAGGAPPAPASQQRQQAQQQQGRSPAQSLTDQLKSLLSVGTVPSAGRSPAQDGPAFPAAPSSIDAHPAGSGAAASRASPGSSVPMPRSQRGPAGNAGRTPTPPTQPPVAAASSSSTVAAVGSTAAASGVVGASEAPLLQHIVDTAAAMLSSTDAALATVGPHALTLLGGDMMKSRRDAMLGCSSIPAASWARLVAGLVAFTATSACDAKQADEALGWVQDVADDQEDALKLLDCKALSAAVARAPHADKRTVRTTLLLLRR